MSSTIALFVQHPRCSVQSVNGVIKALGQNYNYKVFTKHEVEDDYFDAVDCVCFPGGVGDSDTYDVLFKHHEHSIRRYVQNGGHFFGICMGAYWAGSRYFDILSGLDAVQYIKRPTTEIKRSYGTVAEIEWLGQKEKMFFYDGCTYTGDGECDIVARYANGEPMAIIQGNIGIIGCHPESEEFRYEKPVTK